MEGIMFYWFSWMGWILTTFFMKKDKNRTMITTVILLSIIFSNYSVNIVGMSINASFVIILFFTSSIVAVNVHGWTLVYFVISSLILTMGYVGFHLFELFDPVWLLFDRKWMLSIAVVYLTLMLFKDSTHRLIGLVIGVCNGELLYTFILRQFAFPYKAGAFHFLDVLAIMSSLVVIWSILEKVTMMWESHFQTRTKGKAG